MAAAVSHQQFMSSSHPLSSAQQHRAPGREAYSARSISIHSQHPQAYSAQERVDMRRTELGRSSVISERVIEREIKVPKRVTREEVIEKVIVVPEKVVTEETVEEIQKIREKIVEVAKPVIKETYIEVPEVVYVEKVVEVPERVQRESVKQVPVYEYRDRIVEVPKIVKQERIVEVPEFEYREVPFEKIVEVPEVHEQVVIREVPVPQYVDKIIPEYVTVNVPQDVVRHIPVPIAATTSFNYELPRPKPKYETVDLNVYVPRFIEVPIPAEFMDIGSCQQAQMYIDQVNTLSAQPAASLCEIENLAGTIRNSGIAQVMDRGDYPQAVMEAWKSGQMKVNTQDADTSSSPRRHTREHRDSRDHRHHDRRRHDRDHRKKSSKKV